VRVVCGHPGSAGQRVAQRGGSCRGRVWRRLERGSRGLFVAVLGARDAGQPPEISLLDLGGSQVASRPGFEVGGTFRSVAKAAARRRGGRAGPPAAAGPCVPRDGVPWLVCRTARPASRHGSGAAGASRTPRGMGGQGPGRGRRFGVVESVRAARRRSGPATPLSGVDLRGRRPGRATGGRCTNWWTRAPSAVES